jgi:hypothetical protein
MANIITKYALTGGASNALDFVDGADLSVNDVAFVWYNGLTYHYILDESGAAESSPSVIAPDANAGNKRWKLQGVYAGSLTLGTPLPVASGGTGAATAAAAFTALKQAATESATGVVELATTEESLAGTSTTLVVTPAGLAFTLGAATAKFSYDSATTSPAASTARTVPAEFTEWLTKHMRGCVMDDAGVVKYYLKDTDWSLKEDGTASVLTGADGQVMVQVPAFYHKSDYSGTVTTWTVSSGNLPSLQLHPAFIKDGVPVKYRYIGAYNACVYDTSAGAYISGLNLDNATALVDLATDMLASVKGVYPMVGLTRAEFRTLARKRGTFWRQLDYTLVEAIRMLYLVENQTFFSQTVLGLGNTNDSYLTSSSDQNDSPHTIAGAGDAWGSASTDGTQLSAGAKPGTAYMKYRGIENFFGNCWTLADGININVGAAGNVHISNNAALFADDTVTNYTQITASLTTSSTNIQSHLPIEGFFLAATLGGTTSQYVTDTHYGSSTSSRVLRVGGAAHNAGLAGVFAAYASNSSGDRNRTVGSRLAG